VAELGAHVRTCGLTASVSDTTIWRWLSEDAIRPWQHRCWIFPRDPDFEAKANEFVLSADEKNQHSGALPKSPLPTPATPSADEDRARI